MKDERTPDTYFTTQEQKKDALQNLLVKLDRLEARVKELKKRGSTPAHKVIINKEIDETVASIKKKQEYKLISSAVKSIMREDTDAAFGLLKTALDHKVNRRLTPNLKTTGKQIQKQVFRP